MPKKTTQKPEMETPKGKYFYAIGKRKSAVARVRLYKGSGVITINGKAIKEFCDRKTDQGVIKSPLQLTGNKGSFDITVVVSGGGVSAQSEAIRHGISRGLIEANPLTKLTLKKAGMLTRDSRSKERMKPGLKKARKAPQFSKR